MIKKRCAHYQWCGDYSIDLCYKDDCHPKSFFDCKNCQDFVSHTKGLNPCPFCGGKAYLDKTHELIGEWEVFCQKCLVSMKKRDVKKVVEAWNKRTP